MGPEGNHRSTVAHPTASNQSDADQSAFPGSPGSAPFHEEARLAV